MGQFEAREIVVKVLVASCLFLGLGGVIGYWQATSTESLGTNLRSQALGSGASNGGPPSENKSQTEVTDPRTDPLSRRERLAWKWSTERRTILA